MGEQMAQQDNQIMPPHWNDCTHPCCLLILHLFVFVLCLPLVFMSLCSHSLSLCGCFVSPSSCFVSPCSCLFYSPTINNQSFQINNIATGVTGLTSSVYMLLPNTTNEKHMTDKWLQTVLIGVVLLRNVFSSVHKSKTFTVKLFNI